MPERAQPKRLTGRCLCGQLEYLVADAFDFAVNCHCSLCRRTTGAAFKPLAGIGRSELTLLGGEAATLLYGSRRSHNVN